MLVLNLKNQYQKSLNLNICNSTEVNSKCIKIYASNGDIISMQGDLYYYVPHAPQIHHCKGFVL